MASSNDGGASSSGSSCGRDPLLSFLCGGGRIMTEGGKDACPCLWVFRQTKHSHLLAILEPPARSRSPPLIPRTPLENPSRSPHHARKSVISPFLPSCRRRKKISRRPSLRGQPLTREPPCLSPTDADSRPTSPNGPPGNSLTLRALVTTKEAGIIIGKAGKNVADLRERTGVKAGVSKVVPGVHERVLSISGSVESIAKVREVSSAIRLLLLSCGSH